MTSLNLYFSNNNTYSFTPTKTLFPLDAAQKPSNPQILPPETELESLPPKKAKDCVFDFSSHVKDYGFAIDYIMNQLLGERVDPNLLTQLISFQKNHPLFLLDYKSFVAEKLSSFLEKNFSGAYFAYPIALFAYELAIEAYIKQFYDFELDLQSRHISKLLYASAPFSKHPLVLLQENRGFSTEFLVLPWALSGLVHLGVNAQPVLKGYPFASLDSNSEYCLLQLEMGIENQHCYLPVTIQLKNWLESLILFEDYFYEQEEWDTLLGQLLIYLPKNSRSERNIFAENPLHWARFTQGLSEDLLFHQFETLLFSTQLYSNVAASILLFCGFCSGKKDFLLPLVLHGLPKLLGSEVSEVRQLAHFLGAYLMPNAWQDYLEEKKGPASATLHILNAILEEWPPEDCQFLIKGFGSLLPIFLDTQDATLLIRLSQKLTPIYPGPILTRLFLVLGCCSNQMMAHHLLKESWRVLNTYQSIAKRDPETYSSYVRSFVGHLQQSRVQNAGCIPIYVPVDALRKLLQVYAPEIVTNGNNFFSPPPNHFLSSGDELEESSKIAEMAENLSKKEQLSKEEIFQLFQCYNRTPEKLTDLRKTLASLILNWLSDKELKIKTEQLHYIFLKTLPGCFNKKSPLSSEEALLFLTIFNRIPLKVRKQLARLKQLFESHFEEIYKQLLHQPGPLNQCLTLAAQMNIFPTLQDSEEEEEAIVTALLTTVGKPGFSETISILTRLRPHLSSSSQRKAAICILKAPLKQTKQYFPTWLLNFSITTELDRDSLIAIWNNCEKNKINAPRTDLIRLEIAQILLHTGQKLVTAAQLSALLIRASSQDFLRLSTIRKFMRLAHQNEILDQHLKEAFLKVIYKKFNEKSSYAVAKTLIHSEALESYKLSHTWQKRLCLPLLVHLLNSESNENLDIAISLAEKIRSCEFSTQEKECWTWCLKRLSQWIADSEDTYLERFCKLKPRCPASARILQTQTLKLIEVALKTQAWSNACVYIQHLQSVNRLEESTEAPFNSLVEITLSRVFEELSMQEALQLSAPLLQQREFPNRAAWIERWLTGLGENPQEYFSASAKAIFTHYLAKIQKFTCEHVHLLQKLIPLLFSKLASEFLGIWPRLSADLHDSPEELIAFLSYPEILSENIAWNQDSAATIAHLALIALGRQNKIGDYKLFVNRLMRLFASVSFQKAFSTSGKVELLSQFLHDHPDKPPAALLFQVLAKGVLPNLKESPLTQEQILALQKMFLTLKTKTNHECSWHALRLMRSHLNAEQISNWHNDILNLFRTANDTIKGLILSHTSTWDDFPQEIYQRMAAADPLTTNDIFENRIPNKRLLRLCRSRDQVLSVDIWFAILTRIATSDFRRDEVKELYRLWNRTAHAKVCLDELLSSYCLRGLILFFVAFQAEDNKLIEKFAEPERLIVIQKHLFTINGQLTKEKQNYRDFYCNLLMHYAGLCREKGSESLVKIGLVLLSGSILLFQRAPQDTSNNVYSTLTPTLKQLLAEVICQLSKWNFLWASFDTRFLILAFLLDVLDIISFGSKSEKREYMESLLRNRENRIMVLCWAVSSLHDDLKIPTDKLHRIEISKTNVQKICQLILIKSLEWGDEKELAQACSHLSLLTEHGKAKGGLSLAKHLGAALAKLSKPEIEDYYNNRVIVTNASVSTWLTLTDLDLLWQNVFISGYSSFRLFPAKFTPTKENLISFLLRIGIRDQHLLEVLSSIQSYFNQKQKEPMLPAILHVVRKNHTGMIQRMKSVFRNRACSLAKVGQVIWEEGHGYIKDETLQLLRLAREHIRRLYAAFTNKKTLFLFLSELHDNLYDLIEDPALFLAEVKETITTIQEQKYPGSQELRNDNWSPYSCIISLGVSMIKLLLSHEKSKKDLCPEYFECLFFLLQKQFEALSSVRVSVEEVFSHYKSFQELLTRHRVAKAKHYLRELEECSRKIKPPRNKLGDKR